MDAFSFFFVWTVIVFELGMIMHWWMMRGRLKRLRRRVRVLERVLGMPPQ